MVLYCVMMDEDYQELSPEEQNVLKWASLLHDIWKWSSPLIKGKDPVHPFWSAVTFLSICERLNLINPENVTYFNIGKGMIWEAVEIGTVDEFEHLKDKGYAWEL